MKYLLKLALLFSLLLNLGESYSQVMNTTTYRDITLPRIDINPSHYGFIYPVDKDFYDSTSFTPPADGRFLVQNYGPRTIGNYDNHQGSDIWGRTVVNETLTFNPPALCMCDGEVNLLTDGTDAEMELTSSGRKVRVECDSMSQVFNSPINIVFLHLDSIDSGLSIGLRVNQGDTLGFVGSSGFTSLSHLHFDYMGIPNQWGNTTSRKYLNPNRLFDPNEHPHVLSKLDNAHIEVLRDWPDSSLIRIHWPHNQHINRYEFTNGSYMLVYDVEEVRASYSVFEPSIWARDSMKIFPYRTNGSNSALYYEQTYDYPAIFPNSPDRDTNLVLYGFEHIPLSADTVVNVFDFMLEDVPAGHNVQDWVVKLTDVWGYTVEGRLAASLPVELVDFQVEKQPNRQVQIRWTSSSERNNDYFIIERSKDTKQFEEVARIKGAGTSNQTKDYQYKDASPYAGHSYYRLKQLDVDQTVSYSELRSVYLNEAEEAFNIYPNPSSGVLVVEFEHSPSSELLQLMDSSGKLLLSKKVTSQTHSIDISRLPVGVYYISYNGQNSRFTKN